VGSRQRQNILACAENRTLVVQPVATYLMARLSRIINLNNAPIEKFSQSTLAVVCKCQGSRQVAVSNSDDDKLARPVQFYSRSYSFRICGTMSSSKLCKIMY
jgi:hypothetical protein